MITCTRRLEFDAAHRVMNHESKCRTLHGHRYVAEITAHAENLDSLGRVIDFSVIKEKVGGWINEKWDHNVIFNTIDPLLEPASQDPDRMKDPFVMQVNPTAENMADYLLGTCRTLLIDSGVSVTKVRIYETPNCYAEADLV